MGGKTKHGLSDSSIYRIYHHIKDRCYNTKNDAYHNYGGRGIKICDDWLGVDGFMRFYQWSIDHGYAPGLTIDRINNDGDYAPDNCQWITKSQNVAKANKTNRIQHRLANKGCYWGEDLNEQTYVFYNANEFGRIHNLNPEYIRKVANGKSDSYKGWHFGFVKDLLDEAIS